MLFQRPILIVLIRIKWLMVICLYLRLWWIILRRRCMSIKWSPYELGPGHSFVWIWRWLEMILRDIILFIPVACVLSTHILSIIVSYLALHLCMPTFGLRITTISIVFPFIRPRASRIIHWFQFWSDSCSFLCVWWTQWFLFFNINLKALSVIASPSFLIVEFDLHVTYLVNISLGKHLSLMI